MKRRNGTINRRELVAASGAVVLTGIAGPSLAQSAPEEWNKVLAEAKKEGRVLMYSGASELSLSRIKAPFEKAFPGVSLEITRYPSGPLVAKLEQERSAGVDGADFVSHTETAWFDKLAKDGNLLKPVGPSVALWDAKFLLAGTAPVISLEPIGMGYNTANVKTPPVTPADLLKPEFKGRVGILDLLSTAGIAFYDWLEKTQGEGYLEKLAAQKPVIFPSTTPGAQSLAAGEFDVAHFLTSSSVVPLTKKGVPIQFVNTTPSFGIRYASAALGWSKRPNAARVLMEFVISKEGQTAIHNQGDSASALPGIEGSLTVASLEVYDPAKYPPDVAAAFKAKWTKIFKSV